MIEFFIDGSPVGKERPRMGRHGNVYTPSKTKDYERYVSEIARVARNRADIFAPFPDLIFVEMKIYVLSKKSPDIDNIIKSILDGMNKVMYNDDSQVIALDCKKYFECDKEGVNVLISPIENNKKYGSKLILCPGCKGDKITKRGFTEKFKQRYKCLNAECNLSSFIVNE